MRNLSALLILTGLLVSCGWADENLLSDAGRYALYQRKLRIAAVSPLSRPIPAPLGVIVVPPQEPGWTIQVINPAQLILVRRVENSGENYFVSVSLDVDIPQFASDEDFQKQVLSARASEFPHDRLTLIQEHARLTQWKEATCIRFHSVVEDQAAKVGDERRLMIIQGLTYYCQHQKNKRAAVALRYSHRYNAGNEDPASESKADSIFHHVQFTDFKMPIS
jgi:hypothetical protein